MLNSMEISLQYSKRVSLILHLQLKGDEFLNKIQELLNTSLSGSCVYSLTSLLEIVPQDTGMHSIYSIIPNLLSNYRLDFVSMGLFDSLAT